jgi:hypothetical protein
MPPLRRSVSPLLLEGCKVNEGNYRRHLQALGNVMTELGMAAKSRDVTKRDRMGPRISRRR